MSDNNETADAATTNDVSDVDVAPVDAAHVNADVPEQLQQPQSVPPPLPPPKIAPAAMNRSITSLQSTGGQPKVATMTHFRSKSIYTKISSRSHGE